MGNIVIVGICFHYSGSKKSLSKQGIEVDKKNLFSLSKNMNCCLYMIEDDNFEDKHQIMSLVKDVQFDNDGDILIYYSGHFRNGCIVLPNKDLYNYDEMVSDLMESSRINSKIYTVFDCCNFSTQILRYRLGGEMTHKPSQEKCHIIALSSSDVDEKSVNLSNGSVFSNIIFSILKSKESITFEDVLKIETEKYSQRPQAYSNRPWLCSLNGTGVNYLNW